MRWLRGPARDPSLGRTVVDGLVLAVLVVAVFAAERFDRAQRELDTIERSAREDRGAEVAREIANAAGPDWLTGAWVGVAVVGVLAAAYTALRFVTIADELLKDEPRARRLVVRWCAFGAVGLWVVWHVLGILDVSGRDVADGVILVIGLAALVVVLAAVVIGGPVAGGVVDAFEKGSIVRLHLVFLAVLFVVIFNAPVTSDQMTDVLRAWGDGSVARPIAGIAAALLLGAVIRASAARLLVPNEGPAERRVPAAVRRAERRVVREARRFLPDDPRARRGLGVGVPVVLGVVLLVIGMEAAAFLAFAAGAVVLVTRRPERLTAARWIDAKDDSEEERVSLRRLAGTLGALPLAILLAGLVGASVDSLLLPGGASASDRALIGWTALTTVLLGLVAARAHRTDVEAVADLPRGLRPGGLVAGALPDRAARAAAGAHPSGAARDAGDVRPSGAAGAVRSVGGLLRPWAERAALMPAWVAGLAGLVFGWLLAASAVASAVGLALLAAVLAFKAIRRGAPELWGGWGVALGVGIAVYAEPVSAPRGAGAFGLALIGATLVMVALHMAGAVSARRTMRWELCNRPWAPPMLTILAAWALVAFITAPDDAHRARTVPADVSASHDGHRARAVAAGLSASGAGSVARAAAARARQATLDESVRAWLDAQPVPRDGDVVPMLLVGASGGGSKAAYWTDLVLDCVLGSGEPRAALGDECAGSDRAGSRLRRLFLTSSVSGGSIGIHHLVTHRDVAGTDQPWVVATAGREVLSPAIGWGLFHDLPAFLLGLETDPRRCDARTSCPVHADRATVQEAAIATRFDGTPTDRDAGVLAQDRLPVTVFNTTIDEHPELGLPGILALDDRAVFAGSALSPACPPEAPLDGHEVLDGADVPLVTAALLSARFPGLEPPGVLGERWCGADEPLTLRDGGIVENTGVLTILELLPEIMRSVDGWKAEAPADRERYDVRPIVVSIDDDVLGVAGDSEHGGGKAAARSELARSRLRQCRIRRLTYRRISPFPRVGAQAATGWEISETSRRGDLGSALREDTGAGRAIADLRAWLDGDRPPSGCTPHRPG